MTEQSKISTKFRKYRIVSDQFAGYEVQIWRIWWPFWIELGFVNTHFSIESAREYARKRQRTIVEYL